MSEQVSKQKDVEASYNPILKENPSQHPNFQDLYPERRGQEIQYTLTQKAFGHGNHFPWVRTCENNLLKVMEREPLIKLLMSALRAHGCPLDLTRHFRCEPCSPTVGPWTRFGGYDSEHNQIFLCSNGCHKPGATHGAVLRGLIEMFDYCVNKVDFKNVEHLACTEIRKANLTRCQPLNYWSQFFASFKYTKEHPECVRLTAIHNLVNTKFVDKATAEMAVNKVFCKCYNDMEPIGRRLQNSDEFEMPYRERYLLGYE